LSFYLDTSVVVAAFTNEARTADCQQWIREHQAAPLTVSEWVWVEFTAAIGAKARLQTITEPTKERAAAMYSAFLTGGMLSFEVGPDDFSYAAELADRAPVGLRGADALHLAIASRRGATLCTLDKKQAEAGVSLGLPTLLL
jgi:predicted nucleic acid-binding protein